MRKIMTAFGLATALLLPVSAQAVAPAKRFNSCGYEVTAKAVKLRTGPSTRHPGIGQLHRGDDVSADKAKGAWYRVSTDNKTVSGLPAETEGWIRKAHVREHVCMQLD
ncbi:SH3 domain-containing protein [Streptomyces sp. GMY02]|uniref:SH3 domain-containing protein n=1 Tax=Streptomyces sp. GMY02 TaxID=1333528 RepID=UPI001C2BBDB0|nr:SH3 domain-containing protein [Streptomyces sp. GMY02]QXE33998.1 SH3 domain-containing protein [Streptomyces sp. GMY02]